MATLRYQDGRLKIDGNMTIDRVGKLSRDLLTHARREGDMTIDLAAVRRCDSTCVALLAACKEVKQRQQDRLMLVNVPPTLATLFRIYALDGVF